MQKRSKYACSFLILKEKHSLFDNGKQKNNGKGKVETILNRNIALKIIIDFI